MPAVVRPAEPRDVPALAALASALDERADPAAAQARLGELPAAGHSLFLAELDGRLVGWLHVFLTWRLTAGRFAEIGGLAVAPEARRQGVARALLGAAEHWARQERAVALRVRVGLDRQEAPALYAAAGFRALKRQQVFVKGL